MMGNKGRILGVTTVALALGLTGCNILTYNTYPNSDKYIAGNTSYDSNGIEEIQIDWISGSVTLVESDNEELVIKENSDSLIKAQQVHSYVDSDVLRIKFCESGYLKKIDSDYKDVIIEVPSNCKLEINDISADVSLGDMHTKSISFNSVSGNLSAGTFVADGSIDVNTTSGDIGITEVKANKFDFNTVSGNLVIPELDISKIDMKSVSGDMNVGIECFEKLEMDTQSGDARIDISDDFGLSVSKSSVSGNILSNMNYDKDGEDFVFNNGGAKISYNSVSGDIYIK